MKEQNMKPGEFEIVGIGVVYWFVLNVLLPVNKSIEIIGYVISLLFYFILVYIGIKHYKMNDKSVYFSLMVIFIFNIASAFIISFFSEGTTIINAFTIAIMLFSLVIGFVLVTGYIKIVRYFVEEVDKIHS